MSDHKCDSAFITIANYFISRASNSAYAIQSITERYEADIADAMEHAVLLDSDREELDKLISKVFEETKALRQSAATISAVLAKTIVYEEDQ